VPKIFPIVVKKTSGAAEVDITWTENIAIATSAPEVDVTMDPTQSLTVAVAASTPEVDITLDPTQSLAVAVAASAPEVDVTMDPTQGPAVSITASLPEIDVGIPQSIAIATSLPEIDLTMDPTQSLAVAIAASAPEIDLKPNTLAVAIAASAPEVDARMVESVLINTLASQLVLEFNASDSFVVPTGFTTAKIECWAAGGGGNTANVNGGGGGGGGAYSRTNAQAVTPGHTLTVTVGTGGAVGAVGNDSKVADGGTTFTLAKGGQPGAVGSATAQGAGGAGGSSASGTGDVKNSGGMGGGGGAVPNGGGGGGGAGDANVGGAGSSNGTSGGGGTAGGGAGGQGAITITAASAAIVPGGGGGGASTLAAASGGANGLVRVTLTGPSAGFDPSTLALSGWYRASYSGQPWTPTSSAGTSGTAGNLVTNSPDGAMTTGTAVSGLTPAHGNGTSLSLKSASSPGTFITTSAFTLIVLVKPTTLKADSPNWFDNPGIVVDDNGSDWGITVSDAGYHFAVVSGGTNFRIDPGAITAGNWAMVALRFDGTKIYARINSTDSTPVTVGGNLDTLGTSAINVAVDNPNPNPKNWLTGDILEIMTTKTKMTDSDLANVYSYFKVRYPGASLP
jgi:hypothetical protein